MPFLQVIDLSGNKLSGSVPVELTNKVKNGLFSLRLDENPDLCISNTCTVKSKKDKILAPLVASASIFVLLIAVGVFCACRWNRKQGLEYLHSGCKPAIVHRDMKTANILLDDKMQGKIADFGISRIFATESASHISTDNVARMPGYLDPDFGVILLELIIDQTTMIQGNNNMVHIANWVIPFLTRGDIHSVVDKRLHGDFDSNAAWKALETAMACVPSTGLQRPSMGGVLVDLKECLELQLAHEKAMNRAEQEPNSTILNFDGIYVDSEVNMGPSVR